LDNEMFTNSFQTVNHKKIIHGIQQLYIIGKVTIIYYLIS